MCATRRAAEKVGIEAFDFDLPEGTTEAELLALIDRLNVDPRCTASVQLPLPGIPDATRLIDRIDPRKDVDGFHPANIGHLALRQFGLRPCTPRGIVTLLAHTDQPVRGRNATIVGVSNHVGRPMALELLIAGCTVTCCQVHSARGAAGTRGRGRHPGRRGRQAGPGAGRMGQAGRGGDRRGHQSAR
jgi:methylenetetrahydrofolate dehydrogenase (NADP+)/methenyltetrahydrofolate cyclohydrolase